MHELVLVSYENRSRHNVEPPAGSSVALFMGFETVADQFSRSGPAGSAEFVRWIIDARSKRRRYFGDDLFADPAWDILLELYVLHCDHRRTSVSKLSLGAAVPTTTALRWIEKLHIDGLVEREPDPFDARRVWVTLTDRGFRAMQSYLQAIGASKSA